MSNFGRGSAKEPSCKIILKSMHWLKARIRTSGVLYYHQFNRLSFIIVSLLPTKANHLPLVISVLSNQHRSLRNKLDLRTQDTGALLSLCFLQVLEYLWNFCLHTECQCPVHRSPLHVHYICFHFCSMKFEIPTFCLYKAFL